MEDEATETAQREDEEEERLAMAVLSGGEAVTSSSTVKGSAALAARNDMPRQEATRELEVFVECGHILGCD